ncbi:WD40-repeat-containing domain protein, partial [Baffinella frigidus]
VHLGGVVSLVFLGADRLVSVGADAQHTVTVWEWERTSAGDTHDILAVAAAPNQAEEFVTVGVQHIKFWRLPLHSDTMIVRRGIVGNKGRMQTLTCAAFLPSGDGVSLLATGTEDGSIYIWRGRQLHLNIAKAHSGPVFDLVVSTHKAHVLISAGKDDTLHLWEVATSGADVTMHLPGKLPTRPAGLGGIRSLGVRETSVGWASVLVGTGQSALLEVMQAPYGGDVTGLCAHPFVPEIASVGAGGVDFWDTTGTCQDGTLIVFDCSAVPGCAAHTAGGGGGSAEAPVEVFRCQQRVSPLTVVRFSPDGTKVAVGSEDKVVDIYRADASYNRLGVCKFHREAVAHVDWSLDSKILRSIKKLAGGTKTADEQWASHRCSLTWAYQGLPTYMATPLHVLAVDRAHNGAYAAVGYKATPLHVLAVDRAHNGAYAAVGDVYGQVRLVRFPCLDKDAIHVMGASKQGHSAGVRDVRFLADDSRLLSVGGDDQAQDIPVAIFQWRIPAIFQWRIPVMGDREADPLAIFQWRIPVMGDREADPLVARIISALAPPITPLRTAARPEDEEEEEEILTTLRPYHANVHAPKLWSRNGDMQPWKEDPWMLTSPVHDLELEHLYGFRGYDRHGNVLYTATGKTVLYTACVASVLDSASGFQRFFLGHTADLTCLALHPNGRVAASGQGGAHPRVFVWDSERLAARAAEQTRTGAGRSLALLSELDLSLAGSTRWHSPRAGAFS